MQENSRNYSFDSYISSLLVILFYIYIYIYIQIYYDQLILKHETKKSEVIYVRDLLIIKFNDDIFEF